MRVDEALELLGGYGRYQLFVFVVLGLNFMYTPMHIFSDVFTAYEPEHWCKVDLEKNQTLRTKIPEVSGELKVELAPCSVYSDSNPNETQYCPNGFEYNLDEGPTIITEWQLSCKDSQWVIIISVHGAAAVLGAVIFSPFADTYGRKALFLMCWWQTALLSLGMVLVNDISSFLVLRFLSRLYTEGAELAMFILACEFFPVEQRPFAAFSLYLFYATGQMLLAFQAYLIRHWRYLQLSISVGVFVLLPISMMLPESPHWLVSMGKTKSAERIIRRAARINKVSLPPGFYLDSAADPDDETEPPSPTSPEPTSFRQKPAGETRLHQLHPHLSHFKKLADYMKNATLRRDFLVGSFLWAVSAYNYYGLTVIPIKLNVIDGLYLNYFLGGAVMVPAFSSIFLLKRFGRKKPLVFFFAVAGLFIVAYSVIPVKTASGYHLGYAHLVVKLVAKCSTTAALVSTRLLVAELFPTTVRSTCVGLAAFVGFLGGSAGLYFPLVKSLTKWSGVIIGILSLLAAAMCNLLPETSNRPLPENIKDLMMQYRTVVQNMLFSQFNGVAPNEESIKKTITFPLGRSSLPNQPRLHSITEAASVTNVVGVIAHTRASMQYGTASPLPLTRSYDNRGFTPDVETCTKL